ncbi:MAG: right-handed parallel beta-helix repeat-containing protein [Dehalococcoidia bacterium]
MAGDGSGTHRSLADAVAAAHPGATIRLRAGRDELESGFALSHPITFRGEGMDATEIVTGMGDFVLRYEGAGPLVLIDLTVRWAGGLDATAEVVTVHNGSVHIERCKFSGGSVVGSLYGGGLELKGNVSGTVRFCRMEGNGHGIIVGENAQPLLENNDCTGNKSSAIVYSGAGAGTALANTCSANEQRGILVMKQARPTLEQNICREYKQGGIAYVGSAAGTARANTCTANALQGIYIGGQAQPTLEQNTCSENRADGISARDRSAPKIQANTCNSNGDDGIFVAPTASPGLAGNRTRGNKGRDLNDLRR